MRFRKLPKSIPIYTFRDSKRYIQKSINDSYIIELVESVARILCICLLYPYYFIKNVFVALWTAVRYCTYNLTAKEDEFVKIAIKMRELDKK